MILLRRFHVYAYLLVLLSILGFTFAEDNVPLLVLACALIGLSWWLLERGNNRRLPRWLINLGVLASSFLLFRELAILSEPNLLLALGHFMIAILLCKLFESKSNRDYAQILTLSLLIMVTASIFSSAIVFGAILALYLSLGMFVVLLFHLRAETDRAVARRAVTAPAALQAEPAMRRDVRWVAVGSGVVLVAFAAVVFAAFPRGRGREFLGVWSLNNGQSETGFSDHISFDAFNWLQESNALVMQVRLEQGGRDVGSEYFQPYFRGMTLDAYASDSLNHQYQWLRSPDSQQDILDDSRERLREESGAGAGVVSYAERGQYSTAGLFKQHYTLYTSAQGILFAMRPAVTIRSAQIRSVMHASRDAMLRYSPPGIEGVEYEIDTPLTYQASLQDPAPVAFEAGYLRGAGGGAASHVAVPEEITLLARSVAADLLPVDGDRLTAEQMARVAARFEAYLRQTYPYSLRSRQVDPGLDPTADFLKNRKTIGGHCEYFASAMVMMCASVGIPARIATGYHGGEFNALGGFYVVRQRFAHAWVEAYIADRGWVLFDPSPASSDALSGPDVSWRRWFQEFYEVVERDWLSGIVSFDNNTRSWLGDQVFSSVRGTGPWLRRRLGAIGEGAYAIMFAPSTPWGLRLVSAATCMYLCFVGFFLLRRWFRARTSEVWAMVRHLDRAKQRKLAAELRFFDEFMRLLRSSGMRRQAHQTPREYVERVCGRVPGCTPAARWLVATFYDLRFGAASMDPDLRRRINESLGAVRRAVRARA